MNGWIEYAIFDVRGEPKGQPRPRAFFNKKTGRASVYDQGTAEGWKSLVAFAAKPFLPKEPLSGPVRLMVSFIFPRPARLMRKKDPDGLIPHTSKPDSDNCMKAVMDALTQIGMWRDDSQVCNQTVTKSYAGKNGQAGALIQIYRIDEGDAA